MNIKRLFKSNTAGFTLLEVLIALVILAVGILGAASMQVSSIRGNSLARQVSEASAVVSDRIEIIMAQNYDDLENTSSTNLNDAANPDYGPETVDGYVLHWNVAEDIPLVGLKTIRFIVEPPSLSKQFTLDFIKSRITN